MTGQTKIAMNSAEQHAVLPERRVGIEILTGVVTAVLYLNPLPLQQDLVIMVCATVLLPPHLIRLTSVMVQIIPLTLTCGWLEMDAILLVELKIL